MAKGVGREDVFEAADALIREGLRPTIERVRQKMGRGSPNTVSPLLDEWFQTLGPRLKDSGTPASEAPLLEQLGGDALSGLAAALGPAMQQLWSAVVAHVGRALDAEREQSEQAHGALRAQITQLQTALAQAQAQTQEQAELAARAQQNAMQEKAAAVAANALSRTLAEELRQERQSRVQAEQSAHAERQQLVAQAASAERHWLMEVERARQATKAAEKKVQDQQSAHEDALAQMGQQLQEANSALLQAKGLATELRAQAGADMAAALARETELRAEVTRLRQQLKEEAPLRKGHALPGGALPTRAQRWPRGPGLKRVR